MSFPFTRYLEILASTGLNWATSDIRTILVMSNSTVAVEEDKDTVSAFTTLDEYDGANYVRKALAAEAVSRDNPNNRAELTSTTPVTYSSLGLGTRACMGQILYLHVGADAVNVPLIYQDTSPGFTFNGNGADVRIIMNAEGWVQIAR